MPSSGSVAAPEAPSCSTAGDERVAHHHPPAVPTTTATSSAIAKIRGRCTASGYRRGMVGPGAARPPSSARGREVGRQGHLVHDQLGPWQLRWSAPGPFVGDDAPVEQELAAPDAPGLLAVEG